MGKTGSKKTKSSRTATKSVSWRTLSRQAASLEQAHGHPTAKSKNLRKAAADQRRKERARAAVKPKAKKARRPAKKATPASPRNNRLVKAAQDASNKLREQILLAAANNAGLLGKAHDPSENDTANNNAAVAYSHAEHFKALDAAVIATGNRANDNIVCSFLAMYRHVGRGGSHHPWTVEAETIRALVEVLDRHGYTASGRVRIEKAAPSENSGQEVRKAS